MRPVSMDFNHVQVQIREIGTKAGCPLNGNLTRAIICDLEASRNGIVLGEDGIGKRSRDVRVVVIQVHDKSRYFGIVPEGGRQSRQ